MVLSNRTSRFACGYLNGSGGRFKPPMPPQMEIQVVFVMKISKIANHHLAIFLKLKEPLQKKLLA